MPGYFVAQMNVLDQDEMNKFVKELFQTLKPYKGWLVAASHGVHLEGEGFRSHNVVIEFPTSKHANDWYHSDAYQKIIPIRHAATDAPALAFSLPDMFGDINVSGREHYSKKTIDSHGKRMSYVDVGEGDPIIFLHGNPTSSYLWRNVIPYLQDQARCIAPDLIGMGDSDKLEDSEYTFLEHQKYLDEFLMKLGVEKNVTLVLHDWGSALGFDWANRHRDKVRGIAYMESIVRPMTWEEFPATVGPLFKKFRSSSGEKMILEKNMFVENVLPSSILRRLGDAELNAYCRPFLDSGESRRPTLTFPRQLPINGEPKGMVDVVQNYADWLASCKIPKLFINAEPGTMLTGPQREFCRTWSNQKEVTVKGLHYIQEDSPDEIGAALLDWYSDI